MMCCLWYDLWTDRPAEAVNTQTSLVCPFLASGPLSHVTWPINPAASCVLAGSRPGLHSGEYMNPPCRETGM